MNNLGVDRYDVQGSVRAACATFLHLPVDDS